MNVATATYLFAGTIEDERSDVSPPCRRQHAADFECSNIPGTRLDDSLERTAGWCSSYLGFFSGLPTHKLFPFIQLTITR